MLLLFCPQSGLLEVSYWYEVVGRCTWAWYSACGMCGLGGWGSSLPWAWNFGGFPCSVPPPPPPQVALPTEKGRSFRPTPLENHTAYAVECPTRTKKQPNPESSSGAREAALYGEKTGARGLKVG